MKHRKEKWDLPQVGEVRVFGDANGSVMRAAVKTEVLFFKEVRELEGRGKAVRTHDDLHDPTVGGLLAAGRALVDLGKAMQNEAWDVVRKRDQRKRVTQSYVGGGE